MSLPANPAPHSQVELEDPVENIGAKLVRQAAARTNDTAGDGTTTATIMSAAFISEGMKIVAAGTNPVQLTRGMVRAAAVAATASAVAGGKRAHRAAKAAAAGPWGCRVGAVGVFWQGSCRVRRPRRGGAPRPGSLPFNPSHAAAPRALRRTLVSHPQDKTVAGLVKELAKLSTEVASDKDLANVASVSGARGWDCGVAGSCWGRPRAVGWGPGSAA